LASGSGSVGLSGLNCSPGQQTIKFQMKIKITSRAHKGIAALREQLAAALEREIGPAKELSRLSERRDKLQREIEGLEADANPESDGIALKLAAKREAISQTNKRIESLSTPDDVASGNWLGEKQRLLRDFTNAAVAALTPEMERYASGIARKIRPFCPDDGWAMGIAYRTPAAKEFSQRYSFRFSDFDPTPALIQSAIARADEILSGELDWKFDPKQNH
jgi:hypothetical protein